VSRGRAPPPSGLTPRRARGKTKTIRPGVRVVPGATPRPARGPPPNPSRPLTDPRPAQMMDGPGRRRRSYRRPLLLQYSGQEADMPPSENPMNTDDELEQERRRQRDHWRQVAEALGLPVDAEPEPPPRAAAPEPR